MNRNDYWVESVGSSFDEHGIEATPATIAMVAGDMEISHQQEGMAFGDDVASENLAGERMRKFDRLVQELKDERSKVVCPICKGRGSLIDNGPCHSSTSECYKCRGDGRIAK